MNSLCLGVGLDRDTTVPLLVPSAAATTEAKETVLRTHVGPRSTTTYHVLLDRNVGAPLRRDW